MSNDQQTRNIKPAAPLTLPTGRTLPNYGDSWAAIVGIDRYAHLPQLDYARADAQALHELLVGRFGFHRERVFTLLDEAATREAVEGVLVDSIPSGVGGRDRAIIFLAGHIFQRRFANGQTVAYLAPVDAQPDQWRTFIELRALQSLLNLSPAKHILHLLAAAHDETVANRELGIFSPDAADGRINYPARQVLVAAPAGQTMTASGADDLSAFTRALLHGMGGAAKERKDDVITATKLARYVQKTVASDPDATNAPAYGRHPEFDQGGDFVFLAEKEPDAPTVTSTPAATADVELRVTRASENRLAFFLRARDASIGQDWQPVGDVPLPGGSLGAAMTELWQRVDRSIGHIDEMRRVGEDLADQLLPESFQQIYWQEIKPRRVAGSVKTMLVRSDELWIPWEILAPYRFNEIGRDETDLFWGEAFQLGRWPANRQTISELSVQSVCPIMPTAEHSSLTTDRQPLKPLVEVGVKIGAPLRTVGEVLNFTADGGAQVVHYALLDQAVPTQTDGASLPLDGDALTRALLSGSALRGLRRERPLVFFNAAYSARATLSLQGVESWATLFSSDAQASAFVGQQWPIGSEQADHFARHFYEALAGGQTLGQAMMAARSAIREMASNNGSSDTAWLAYALVGNPNLRVVVKDATKGES